MNVRVYVTGRDDLGVLWTSYSSIQAVELIKDIQRLEGGRITGQGQEGNAYAVHMRVPVKPARFIKGSRAKQGQLVTAQAINDLIERIEAVEATAHEPQSVTPWGAHVDLHTTVKKLEMEIALVEGKAKRGYELARKHIRRHAELIENLERGWSSTGFRLLMLEGKIKTHSEFLVLTAQMLKGLVQSLKKSSFKKRKE